jgi:hypothetical protein
MQNPSQPHTEQEADELAERFFSQPPEAWEVTDEPEPWRPAPLTKGERLAMLATVMPIAIGASVAIGLFVFSDPLFASAEPEAEPAQAQVAAAAPSPAHDATQHGLTALAKASPIAVAAPALDAVPQPQAAQRVEAAPQPQAAPHSAAAPQPSEPRSVAPTPMAAAASAAPTVPRVIAPTAHSTKPITSTAAARPASAGSSLARARKALDAGKPHEARALATEAIGRNPNGAAAYIVLAGALDALGDRAGMQATFRSCAARATDALASACRSLLR